MSSGSSDKGKRYVLILCLWGLSVLLVAVGSFILGGYAEQNSSHFERAYVTRVIDGDTIELQGGQMVRYIGIDAPETVHPEKGVQCYGPEASNRNKQFVEGKFVELLKGIENEDKYGRLLRYVFVDGVFVNAELVAEGYARQSGYGEERRFQQVFVQLEQYSMSKNRGLWSSCP